MKSLNRRLSAIAILFGVFVHFTGDLSGSIEPAEVFSIWPGKPPGPIKERGPEKLVEGRPRPFYQITDVSQPTVSVYLPPKERRTGAAVLVLPGGGLQRLAIEHEGIEVAEWLTALNISVFVLKYRVPERVEIALQDAQRALSLVRARAHEWAVDPDDIGVVGFSAGAELAAWLATHHQNRRYESIDANDTFSYRPAYAALIYPGGLTQGTQWQLKETIASHIDAETPPMFIAQAFDDSSENSLAMMLALKRAKIPGELHIYQEGGHGFGMRESGAPVGSWKERWREWLQWQGFLDPAAIRNYALEFASAITTQRPTPRLSEQFPTATVADAYAAQKRLVRARLRGHAQVAGFKSVVGVAAGDIPISGVIFRSEQHKAADVPVLDHTAASQVVLGLGFRISVDMSTRLSNDIQTQGAVSSVAPVVQLVTVHGSETVIDRVAANLGNGYYIVGTPKTVTNSTAGSVVASLKCDGKVVGDPVKLSQDRWMELRRLLNQLTGEGYTLHAGDLIVCGASDTGQLSPTGKYEADFGALGAVAFELR